ncbi:MAG TPA: pyruvate, phosphate dikinase [Candidatus Limnocylindrales bacterium]
MTRIIDFDRPPEGVARQDLPRLLGGKAANLTIMAVDFGLPVPPAFTLTTDVCREYLASGWPPRLEEELREHMARLEELVGRRFGEPADPLLVSVRSGAPVSMPGMMDTILNVGLNAATSAAFDESLAPRLKTRLSESLAAVGVEPVPEDQWGQLRAAIEAVFRSWNSPRAIAYREREGISADMGTAATVQAMVFGNRNERSATGVLFTRNPSTGENRPYGDVLFNAQGEDVVAGTHATEDIRVLHKRLPDVARLLHEYTRTLERHLRDMADIEFTIEDGKLWLLQVRVGKRSPQAALRLAAEMADDPDFPLSREEAVRRVLPLLADPPRVTEKPRDAAEPLTKGLGASPGVAAGEVVTTPEAAVTAAEQGRAVILVRAETSPDDVHGMSVARGILTATGGLASHAAVVARGWGIPAVVGAAAVSVGSESISVNGRQLKVGDQITIDGSTGEVFGGALAGSSEVVPEAATLLDWARELGIPIEGTDSPASPSAESPGTATPADALRLLLVKGYATPEQAAECLMVSLEDARSLLAGLETSADVEQAVGSYRLTDAGKVRARMDLDAARAAWPGPVAALDEFVGLDKQVKDVVTSWQMRGESVNDHSDAAYDALVLNGLAELHNEIQAWLPSRFNRYRQRLDRAAAAVAAGDTKFVASPRVDSYHSAWFELHEELILLAGRTRADEVAAGRA